MATDERPPEEVSREHADYVLKRERRDLERLAGTIGRDVTRKIDRVVARDLVHELRQRALDDVFGAPRGGAPAAEHEVIVMMRSALRSDGSPRPVAAEDRRRKLASMQRSGAQAVARLERDLEDRPAEVLSTSWLTHSALVAGDSDEVVRLAGRADVASVASNKPRPALALDVSRPLIGADRVETELGVTGRRVRVAVIDTGVDATHPALAGVIASQTDLTGEGTGDVIGHGTHCAGIIGSQDATRRGIAPGVTIDDIKILPSVGLAAPQTCVDGLTAATTMGSDVSSNSWGFSHGAHDWVDPDESCVLCVAATNSMNAGVVVVVAAGNEDNDTCDTYDTHLRCPANADAVITVAASDDSDAITDFSSIGPTADGRAKPDIAAPGKDIGSCRAAGTSMGTPIDALWTNADGTSMACPHVAGVAALMLEQNPAATPATVKGTLMSTAVDLGEPPERQGAGRVDALAAVNAI